MLRMRSIRVEFAMRRGIARVVDNVDLDIYEGEVLGIIGESGSGKSMLASVIMRTVPPGGRVVGSAIFDSKVLNREVDLIKLDKKSLQSIRWREIAMVFQGAQNSFNPVLKIKSHFLDTARAHGWLDRDAVLEKARKLLEMVRLDADRVLESYPHELSGGMKQRTLIALALLLDPRLLILDEPTSALDTISQRVVMDILKDLHRKLGITMIFITHDVPLAIGFCTRIAIMYAFKILEIGSLRDVFTEPLHPYTQGLLSAIPSLHEDIEKFKPIPGRHPDPVNPPPGCRFWPRCRYATDRCKKEEPPMIEVKPGHFVKCWLYVKR